MAVQLETHTMAVQQVVEAEETTYTVPYTNQSWIYQGTPTYDFIVAKHSFYKVNRYTGEAWVLNGHEWFELLDYEKGE